MRVLVTGVNGFLGRAIARELRRVGINVVGLASRVGPSDYTDQDFVGSVLDPEIVSEAMRNVHVVVHLAAITEHERIVLEKFETLTTNLEGTKNVLEAFNRSPTASKFIFASTGKVYGHTGGEAVLESVPPQPMNVLGKSKYITERLIDFYSIQEKSFVVFRIFQAYGYQQKNNFLIPTILRQLDMSKKTQQTLLLGDTTARRDYVYIDDVASAVLNACDERRDLSGVNIFNIATGKSSSAMDIVQIIENKCGIEIEVVSDKTLVRSDEASVEFASYQKARKELDWQPKVDLTTGVSRLVDMSWS